MIDGTQLRASLVRLPRASLAFLPTPLYRAQNLSRLLGIDLWIKRDDLTGLAFGGNKVRKLEFILGDALQQGATRLLTTASAQSNFCRVVAAAGCQAQVRVGLLLRGSPGEPVQGNLLLDHLLGAEIRFTDDINPYSEHTREQLEAWAAETRAAGDIPYVIYIHHGSRAGALATAAYVDAAIEIDQQCREYGLVPKHLYVAVGSGSSLAGLALGARLRGGSLEHCQLHGICVGELSPIIRPKINEFLGACADLLGVSPATPHIQLDDTQRGDAYGVPTPAAIEAIRLAARAEALFFNPVYTGKAFAALLADIRNGVIRTGETVLFLNTGGDPLLFAYADQLGGSAQA